METKALLPFITLYSVLLQRAIHSLPFSFPIIFALSKVDRLYHQFESGGIDAPIPKMYLFN